MRRKHKIVEENGFYRVKYPDGVLSEDFYNLTRAKNHAAVLDETASRIAYRRHG